MKSSSAVMIIVNVTAMPYAAAIALDDWKPITINTVAPGPVVPTGKEPSDVAHRKKTLPVIYAWEHAGPEDRARLGQLTAAANPTADEVGEIIAILERTGAREFTRNEARRYRDEALAELDAAGVVRPEVRARLEEIIVSVISA